MHKNNRNLNFNLGNDGIFGVGIVQWAKPQTVIVTSHIRVPLWVLIALFLIQLPANVPGRAAEDGSTAAPAMQWETRVELAPYFGLAQPKLLSMLAF